MEWDIAKWNIFPVVVFSIAQIILQPFRSRFSFFLYFLVNVHKYKLIKKIVLAMRKRGSVRFILQFLFNAHTTFFQFHISIHLPFFQFFNWISYLNCNLILMTTGTTGDLTIMFLLLFFFLGLYPVLGNISFRLNR